MLHLLRYMPNSTRWSLILEVARQSVYDERQAVPRWSTGCSLETPNQRTRVVATLRTNLQGGGLAEAGKHESMKYSYTIKLPEAGNLL